ncbi:hypothetical protein [Pseudoalteromonas sp. T1lg23B]|uniref:hypothetical protein n=1 Tax=Pseudoalteromonas sp. T1lg23B TaxID=2077097 RepID=UPI001319BF48|nr:hypothetical protein [Pseudoalteromonas sp. T1lg23B]
MQVIPVDLLKLIVGGNYTWTEAENYDGSGSQNLDGDGTSGGGSHDGVEPPQL